MEQPARILRVISLGAGVQSTTIALMAEHGEIEEVDAAVFADTQSEPDQVYRHLDWLERQLSYPVYRVSAGSLRQEILDACAGLRGAWGRPPFFIRNPDGSVGMTRRQCTQDYKLVPILRKLRELAGIKPRGHGPKDPVVEQIIGISWDEAHRMKPPKFRWIRNSYPLVERRMTRGHCLEWMAAKGYPRPPKSACTFCPYHDTRMWRDMRRHDTAAWEDAVKIDRAIRDGAHYLLRGTPYLHASCRPLEDIDFATLEDLGQTSLFGNECEGLCGV